MGESAHVHFDGETLQRERTKSFTSRKKTLGEKEADVDSNWSDEPYGLEERDYKKKQVCGSFADLFQTTHLLMQSLDVQGMDVVVVSFLPIVYACSVILLLMASLPALHINRLVSSTVISALVHSMSTRLHSPLNPRRTIFLGSCHSSYGP
jgi:hypothetical protein